MANNFDELLQTLQIEKHKTEDYLKEKENHLTKAKELLSVKEDELKKMTEYMNVLLNVIQALKLEISSTEYEMNAIKLHLGISNEHKEVVEKVNDSVNTFLDKVSNGSFKEKKPDLNIRVHSVSDVKKLAESLSTVKDEEVEEKTENDVVDKDMDISTSKDVSDTKVEKIVEMKKDDWVIACSTNTEDKDFCYLQLVESNCRKPADDANMDVWRRRVLVKYYMESGLSTVNSILARYNKYAEKYKLPKATESSISKDMKRIFDGEFKLEVVVYAKNIFESFRPASMLSSEETCQINEMISKLEKKFTNKSNMITKIQDYAKLNMSNMSTYKLRAVKSFIEEQLDN